MGLCSTDMDHYPIAGYIDRLIATSSNDKKTRSVTGQYGTATPAKHLSCLTSAAVLHVQNISHEI